MVSCVSMSAQTWDVPEASAKKISPVFFNGQTVHKGEALFKKNCMQCHGEPTKANFVQLTPSPGDPAGEQFQKESDGVLFFKLSNGRGAMPAFKNIFDENERWSLISYIRSFNKKYIQPSLKDAVVTAQAWMELRYNREKKILQVIAKGLEKKDTVSIKNAEATLFLKRYFGKLKLKSASTDAFGMASFVIPDSLPGDKEGNIELLVNIADDQFGEIQQSSKGPWGLIMNKPSLTNERAMWGVMSKAPVWLYLLYGGVVLIVWGFIFYIVFGLFKIWKSGQIKNE